MGETGNVQAAPVPAPQDGGLSFAGLIRVFYEPAAFFTRLKDNPKVLVPYLALAAMIIVFFSMTGNLLVDMTLKAMREQPTPPPVMPPRFALQMSIIGFGTIALLLAPLVASLLAMFWGNFIYGGKARFKQLLSVVLYGEIIYGAGMVVTGLLMLYKKSVMVSLSLAVLLSSPNPQDWLYVLLSKFSVFLIWELIALGIGLSVLYGVPRNKGYLLSVLSMGMLSLLQVAWTAIMA